MPAQTGFREPRTLRATRSERRCDHSCLPGRGSNASPGRVAGCATRFAAESAPRRPGPVCQLTSGDALAPAESRTFAHAPQGRCASLRDRAEARPLTGSAAVLALRIEGIPSPGPRPAPLSRFDSKDQGGTKNAPARGRGRRLRRAAPWTGHPSMPPAAVSGPQIAPCGAAPLRGLRARPLRSGGRARPRRASAGSAGTRQPVDVAGLAGPATSRAARGRQPA